MQILTLIFSMFLGFLGGYFAARIAVDQAMHDRKKLDRELTSSAVENERDIVRLDDRIDQVETLVLSHDNVRTTDGENLNKNFAAIKDFMKQQHAINAQVNQALYVLQHMNDKPAEIPEDEKDITEEEVIDRIREIMEEQDDSVHKSEMQDSKLSD